MQIPAPGSSLNRDLWFWTKKRNFTLSQSVFLRPVSWNDSFFSFSVFLNLYWLKVSINNIKLPCEQSLLRSLSRKIEGDSARRVISNLLYVITCYNLFSKIQNTLQWERKWEPVPLKDSHEGVCSVQVISVQGPLSADGRGRGKGVLSCISTNSANEVKFFNTTRGLEAFMWIIFFKFWGISLVSVWRARPGNEIKSKWWMFFQRKEKTLLLWLFFNRVELNLDYLKTFIMDSILKEK